MALLDDLMGMLGGGQLDSLGRAVGGSDPDATRDALAAAIPAIIGGLASNASTRTGAEDLYGALARDHDGSVVNNLGQFFGSPDTNDGNGILRHVFGDRRSEVEKNIASRSGLDIGTIAQLLPILAPIIMGYLGKHVRQNNLDPGGLSNTLQVEKKEAEARGIDLGSILGGLIDKDRDGQIKDDILGGIFRRIFKR